MQILSRSEAKEKQQATYFTGQPCKHGHVAKRYTQSGTCSECINGDRNRIADPMAATKREAKADLVKVRIRAFDEDRDALASSAWALAVMRYPMLQLGDVDPRHLAQDKAGGTGLYAFYCHNEDVPQLRAIADGMLKAHKADVVAVRRAAFGSAADVPMAPVPDWARTPQPGDPDYK